MASSTSEPGLMRNTDNINLMNLITLLIASIRRYYTHFIKYLLFMKFFLARIECLIDIPKIQKSVTFCGYLDGTFTYLESNNLMLR